MQVKIFIFREMTSNVVRKCGLLCGFMFNKYLFLTNVGISVSLSAAGDIIQQHYEIVTSKRKKWDRVRTHHMSVSGMTVGIICHNWYKFLDRKLPGRTLSIVLKKVVVDQIVCSPVCIMAFFLTLGYLEQFTLDEIREEIIQKGQRLYLAEWVVWPPAQIINFYLLPTKYRVLYDNTVSLGYDIYTSYVRYDNSNNDRKISASENGVRHDDS